MLSEINLRIDAFNNSDGFLILKYSIIIPTLNEEKLLPSLLLSLINPSLRSKYPYEVIVSDGGSTDSTLAIAEKYSDKVVRYLPGETRTIAACRSKGAKCAMGDNLLFINSDVRIDLESLLSASESEFVTSNYVAMTCPVRCLPELATVRDSIFSAVVNSYYFLSNSIGLGIARGELQMIKRRVYDNVDGYNEEIVVGEDYELFTRIRRLGRVLFCRKLIVYESPRRYHSWGYLRTVLTWLSTSMGPWFRKKSSYKDWEAIR